MSAPSPFTNRVLVDAGSGKQWLRKAHLLIAKRATSAVDDLGNAIVPLLATTTSGIDISASDFHFTFELSTSDQETPNNMVCRIYNMDPGTIQTVVQEYDQVSLSAGYEGGNYGIIFTGTIRWFKYGKEEMTDNFLEITAGDNDGYNFGFINTTLRSDARMVTWIDVYNQCVKAFRAQRDDDTLALLAESGIAMPRGRVLWGPARVVMHDLAESLRARWSIINGKLVVLQDKSVRKNAITILGPQSGLIGAPTVTDQGIEVRCLLNPTLAIGSKIEIRRELIVETALVGSPLPNAGFLGYNKPVFAAKVSNSDLYRILLIDYTGDTRGNDWYCDMVCVAMDPVTNTVVGVI
jgi:hypothetical protein